MQGLGDRPRDAAGDLLAAFVLVGWEIVMPLQEAVETADFLAWDDPEKARRLSGSLVRGEPMPPDVAQWVSGLRLENTAYRPPLDGSFPGCI